MQHLVDWLIFRFVVEYCIDALKKRNSGISFCILLVARIYCLGNTYSILRHGKKISNLLLVTLGVLI